MEQITQDMRLMAAARIKAIGDSGNDCFNADDAQTLDNLLHSMPRQRASFSMKGMFQGPSTKANAAGVGNVNIAGQEKKFSLAVGEAEFRCGAYIVTREGDHCYDIRHVGDVDACMREGESLRLKYEAGNWNAYLNRPRRLRIWPFLITIGGRYDFWKRGM